MAAPPAELAGWEKPAPLPAARRPAELTAAELTPGKAVTAQLFPVADIEYRVPPQKADGPAVYGGLYELRIAEAGTYRVASSAGPWMDIFTGVTPVVSTAHGHGPPCTGVGKYVDFPLSPGDYLVQFSESLTPKTEIMVAKVGRE
ncbi:MAG: homogentisate 1,2-dioxygenase [Caulobacteraceae bacterium]